MLIDRFYELWRLNEHSHHDFEVWVTNNLDQLSKSEDFLPLVDVLQLMLELLWPCASADIFHAWVNHS